MPCYAHGRIVVLLSVVLLALLPPTPPHLGAATAPTTPTAVVGAPPLPRSCIRGAPLDSFTEALCCVSGYVYLNGVPIADAEVTISVAGRSLSTRTRSGPDSGQPYFAASLNGEPLKARPGDRVTISATAGGQTSSVTFIAQEGGRQEDVVLPQDGVEAAWVQGEIPRLAGAAMAYDAARQRVVLFGAPNSFSNNNDTWEWDGTSWIQRITPIAPPARGDHALAYDADRQRVVLFGGYGDKGSMSDTWEWDGASWAQRTPAVSPPVRFGHAMVYDAARQRVVLFGSYTMNDTWEWDGSTWTQRLPATSPPVHTDYTMAYDAARQRVILFGGSSGGSTSNDTWEWDGTNWTQRTPATTPPARRDHAMTYDALRQRIVLFGGYYGNSADVLGDTWEWDGTTWLQRTTATAPVPTYGGVMVYDTVRHVSVLFGGSSFKDTWEWDGTNWIPRSITVNMRSRSSHAMAYDSARQRLVLFGGDVESKYPDDTWEWDGTNWIERTPTTRPAGRVAQTMAYDTTRQRVVLFGGWGSQHYDLNDTWEWDGTSWIERTPTTRPPARSHHAMAYDSTRQRIVLFGGTTNGGRSGLNDTWEWDGTNWIERTPASAPSVRSAGQYAMAYDAARQRIVLFGGTSYSASNNSYSNETWEWDGANWTQQTAVTNPPVRYDHTLAYDSIRKRVVLFGGNHGSYFNDTWEWDGTTWTQRSPIVSPSGRSHSAIAYDTAHQRIVLFGGYAGSNSYFSFGDTWEYDGLRWRLAMNYRFTEPWLRMSQALAYEANGNTLFFGGYTEGSILTNDTYRWNGTGWRRVTSLHLPPPARHSARMARNSDGVRLLLFGGINADGAYLDDTWLWDSANDDWLVQTPAHKPAARARYGLTYDQNRKVWLLFGGQNSSGYLGDTWEYDGTTWLQRTLAANPPARAGATLTYDAAHGRAVLIGGQTSSGYLDDVWEWDGSNWANVTPAQRLSARAAHSAAYDSTHNVVVVAGGIAASGELSDTWVWNGSSWHQRTTSINIPAMYNHAMDYDAAHERMVIFGGENSSGAAQGVYLHQVMGASGGAAPVATINAIMPRDARQGLDSITFEGSGADADSSNLITAYRWSLNDTVISTQASFSRSAADFPLGAQTIRFAVQDNEGEWSPVVEQTIYIRDGAGSVADTSSWTLLIYAAADNNLDPWMGDNPALNGMLYRLQRAGAQAEVQVGILYDGPDANDTSRYTLGAGGAWNKTDLPEARMDEMETLRDFILWGRTSLPATDHYALAIVDHANGVVGIAQDETSKRAGDSRPFLTPLEVRLALQAATDDGAHKLDVLHYDGCSFGLFENAAIAAGLVDFVIASPNTGWGIFAYDRYRQLAGTAANPRAYAIGVASHYAAAIDAEHLPYTIAVLDMAHFTALNAAISTLGQSLLAYVQGDTSTRRDALKTLRLTVQKYDSGDGQPFEPDNEDSYVDVVDLAQKLKSGVNDPAVQTAADQIIALALPASQHFVIYEGHTSRSFTYPDSYQGGEHTYNVQLDNAHGLGLYYPPRSTTNVNSAYMAYIGHRLFNITRDSGWTSFLGQALLPQLNDDPSPLLNSVLIAPFIPSPDPTLPSIQRSYLPLVIQ